MEISFHCLTRSIRRSTRNKQLLDHHLSGFSVFRFVLVNIIIFVSKKLNNPSTQTCHLTNPYFQNFRYNVQYDRFRYPVWSKCFETCRCKPSSSSWTWIKTIRVLRRESENHFVRRWSELNWLHLSIFIRDRKPHF